MFKAAIMRVRTGTDSFHSVKYNYNVNMLSGQSLMSKNVIAGKLLENKELHAGNNKTSHVKPHQAFGLEELFIVLELLEKCSSGSVTLNKKA